MRLNCYVDAETKIYETYIAGLHVFLCIFCSIKNAEIKLEVLLYRVSHTPGA